MTMKAPRYSHDKSCYGQQPTMTERSATVKGKSPEEPPAPRHSTSDTLQESKTNIKHTIAEFKQQRLTNWVSQGYSITC